LAECGRVITGVPRGTLISRLFLTTGTGGKIAGICIYFTRVKTSVNITIKNVAEVNISPIF